MIPSDLVWCIFLLPLISFVFIALVLKPLNVNPKTSGYISIASVAVSLVLSIWVFISLISVSAHELIIPEFEWLVTGGLNLSFGLMIDMLTVVLLIVVTSVSLMVQIYSQGYMSGDKGYPRYFAYMSLFTASMLGLVMSNNLIMTYTFWELVGFCSYLLIGFWFHKPEAAAAAKKAFIVTRIGDFGFLAAILLLFSQTGTLDITQLNNMAVTGLLAGSVLTWAAIGIFMGAVGKSAQFPLHVWLPDAMEGPTPVSALIHAATMVAAGVFLVARMYPLFENSATALLIVAIIGGFTAIFAATMGLVSNDIKRVLAYSTISQLGYMMLGLGTGGIAIGIFHLFNHAFFKSLLFLGAGSVNHATGTFDMRRMGGLRKVMPYTFITFLIAALSMTGIWPLAGFWSKDEILVSALSAQPILFVLGFITVFMTAFYMFRIIFMTFFGEYRGDQKAHESPKVMLIPMIILAFLAITGGLLNANGWFDSMFGHGEVEGFWGGFFGILAHPLTWLSLLMTIAGIFCAYAIYKARWLSADAIIQLFRPLYNIFNKKYWIDDLYETIIGKKVLLNGLFSVMKSFDISIVDKAVNGVATSIFETGRVIKKIQTGQLQMYSMFILFGIILIAAGIFIWG